jgi:hypothetical protein
MDLEHLLALQEVDELTPATRPLLADVAWADAYAAVRATFDQAWLDAASVARSVPSVEDVR